jgi:hypothetical protein
MKESKFFQIVDAYPLLKHPEKYNGSRPISVRSGWEAYMIFKYLDINSNIVSWKSESTVIKYLSPLDGKYHRYFMDFTVTAKTTNGSTKELWLEVKPFAQTQLPKEPKRKTQNYLYQLRTYLVNQAKWETTKKIVEEKKALGIPVEFAIITERDVPGFLKG